ncbi:MAG TPA: hypothetical protein VIB48_24610 [Acidimicrobiia bacterium]
MSTTDTFEIRTFADAIVTAIRVRARFRRAHAVASLDGSGRVRDLTAFTARRHTVDTALAWAACVTTDDPYVSHLLLVSVGRASVEPASEADLERYRRARVAFAAEGVTVLDWIQYDGRRFRSLAFTIGGTDASAWDEPFDEPERGGTNRDR